MDKENLYYIVRKGTNDRAMNQTKDPMIVKKEAIDEYIKSRSEFFCQFNYEAITIAEYERLYVETKSNGQKE